MAQHVQIEDTTAPSMDSLPFARIPPLPPLPQPPPSPPLPFQLPPQPPLLPYPSITDRQSPIPNIQPEMLNLPLTGSHLMVAMSPSRDENILNMLNLNTSPHPQTVYQVARQDTTNSNLSTRITSIVPVTTSQMKFKKLMDRTLSNFKNQFPLQNRTPGDYNSGDLQPVQDQTINDYFHHCYNKASQLQPTPNTIPSSAEIVIGNLQEQARIELRLDSLNPI